MGYLVISKVFFNFLSSSYWQAGLVLITNVPYFLDIVSGWLVFFSPKICKRVKKDCLLELARCFSGHSLRWQEVFRQQDLRRVHPESWRDDGAGAASSSHY